MSFRRVVAGVDFSEASLAAARWTAHHLAPDAELVLVHVVPEPRRPSFLDGHAASPLERAREAVPSLYGALRGLANMLGAHRTRVELLAGAPADALALLAAELDADLICVGRGSGRRGSARFGATTPQRLLARTRLPVLVVPTAPAACPTRILAGADDRQGTDAILRAASWIARRHAARLDVLHVLEPEIMGIADGTGSSLPAGDTVLARRAKLVGTLVTDALDTLKLALLARGWLVDAVDRHVDAAVRCESGIREGDPGQELVAHAHRGAVDLVVVGRGGDASHERLPVGALALGSTARFVMWAAPCPVLVCALDRPTAPRDAARRRDARGAFGSTRLAVHRGDGNRGDGNRGDAHRATRPAAPRGAHADGARSDGMRADGDGRTPDDAA